jgi:hypothetical protein
VAWTVERYVTLAPKGERKQKAEGGKQKAESGRQKAAVKKKATKKKGK